MSVSDPTPERQSIRQASKHAAITAQVAACVAEYQESMGLAPEDAWNDGHGIAEAMEATGTFSTIREALRAEIINAPETADFMAGVPLEAAHQRVRWGAGIDPIERNLA